MTKHPANTIEFTRYLMAANPDQWHQVARSWNWDNGTYRLRWIVEQPSADLATALLIFWLSDPFHNLVELNPYREARTHDRVHIDPETLALQVTILKRWLRDDFIRREIVMGGEFDEGIPYDIVEAFNKANGIIPI